MDDATPPSPRRRVHWLIAAPIGLLVLANLMFMHRAGEVVPTPESAATAAVVAASSASAEAAAIRADADPDAVHFQRGIEALQRKRPKPALALFEGIRTEPLRLLGRAMAHHDMRHATESQLALLQLVRDHGSDAPYLVAQAYAWRHQPDEAFLWLDRAVVQRNGGIEDVKYNPAFESLRNDTRYRALLRRMGQPD